MNDNKNSLDPGPFFHGTKAKLTIGDLLEPLHLSNYQDKKSNHIYFTATLDAAKWGDYGHPNLPLVTSFLPHNAKEFTTE